MQPTHYIRWIDLVADGKVIRQFLQPGGEPVAVFKVEAEKVYAREECNLHGLWRSPGSQV